MESPTLRGGAAPAGAEQSESIVAPRLTGAIAGLIMLGVMVQAVLAGAFLAGRPDLREVHGSVGFALVFLGALVLVVGVIGRFRAREPVSRLVIRVALFLATVITVGAGEMAEHGTRDMLMLHIPLALAIMGMADHLVRAGRRSARG